MVEQVLIEPECLSCIADPTDKMCRECNSHTKNWKLYNENLRKLEAKERVK